KRTFLVRHGRRRTCAFSACCWTAGLIVLLATVHRPTVALAIVYAGCLGGALWLLCRAGAGQGGRPAVWLVRAIRVIGRRVVLLLFAHLSMTASRWPGWRYALVIGVLGVLTAGMASSMARHGPITRITSPFGLSAAAAPYGRDCIAADSQDGAIG